MKSATKLVTNFSNMSLAYFNFFLENLAKNKNIVYFCMVKLSSEGANKLLSQQYSSWTFLTPIRGHSRKVMSSVFLVILLLNA